MTLFSTKALEAAGPGEVPALRVSTKYMETFLPLDPISSGTEIHPFQNRKGALDIYSVGSNRRVYRYSRSENLTAPYVETDLGVDATQLYLFNAAGETSEHPDIFGLDTKGKLVFSRYNGGAYSQIPTGPQDKVIRKFLGARGATGRVYINVVLDDGSLGTNYFEPLTEKWGAEDWAPMVGPDDKPAIVKDITMADNDPVQSAIFAIGKNDEVLFAEESFRSSKLRKLYKRASHIAAISDSNDLLNIFIVEKNTGELFVKTQRKHSIPGKIQFEDWIRVDPGQMENLGRLNVNLRKDGLIEVFALDSQGDIRHTRQVTDARGVVTGWGPLFPIAAGNENTIFAVGRNANGYSEAFSVNAENQLFRFWQSPETQQWFSEVLDLPKHDDSLIKVPTHATEVIVSDSEGAPVMGAFVTINAAYLSTFWVNGQAYRSSLFDPITLKTDITGKIVILQRANALSGATMLISTPATGAGNPIKVQPNAELQSRLSDMTKSQVLNAKDRSGNLLLAADTKDRDKVADSIAQISKKSMDLAQADEAGAPIQYKFASPYGTGFRTEADFSSLGETHWEIDFTSGVPIYKDSTRAKVEAFKKEHAQKLTADGGFLGIDWGNVWSGIKAGVHWLIDGLETIVVTIVDGIASVLFKIAGEIFEAVIKFAQQAFDFIEGIWNWLKVKLEQLYEWLAFLFDFADFKRTADGIKHTVGVALDISVVAVEELKGNVKQGFENLKSGLDETVNKLIRQLNGEGNPSMGNYFKKNEADDKTQHASDHNIFLNAYKQNEGEISIKPDGHITALSAAGGPLDEVFKKMQALSENFQFGDGKQAFDEAFGYFGNIGSNPGQAARLLLSGLIKVLEGAALFALDFAEGIVLTFFDLVKDVISLVKAALFEEWEIPVVSQLYELFTGDKLSFTPITVAAWITAIPMTITSKVVLGRAPWDEEELKSYKTSFTVDYLKARLGLETAETFSISPDGIWTKKWQENFLTGYCVIMGVRSLLDPSSAAASATGKGLGKAGIVPAAARLLTTFFTMPWALSPLASGPSCKPGQPGFGVTIWICQLLCGPLRGMAVHYQSVVEDEAKIYVGEITLTLWGVVHLIMSSVHFHNQEHNKANNLAFSRGILNFVPGQTLRFLAVPGLNKGTEFIPAIILGVLSFLSCWGSLGVAIAEINMDEAEAREAMRPRLS